MPKETRMHCETFGKRRGEVTERRTLPPNGDTDDVFGATLNLMLSSFRGDDAIYMPVEVIGMKFYGMLDSGASHVIVNHEGCRKLKALGLELRESATTSCALADNTTVNCAGTIPTPFNVKGKCCIIDVLVIPSVRYELMLGREFWRKFGLLPNIRDLKFSLADDTDGSGPKLCSINSVQSWDDLSAHHQQALQRAISHYFKAIDGVELGRTSLIEHRIELKDGVKPVQSRNYRVSPYVQREMDKEWKEMLRLGVIRRSESEWNSPAFMIPKKDGTRRFVVNYQKLNAISKRPAYPIPNMTDILEKLGNARFITTLDIRSAYWQIPVEESSRKYTAFSLPGRGIFEFCRMPFGLHGAPGTFQTLIDKLINVELQPYVFGYLDDIIIVTDTFEKHLETREKVLKRLLGAGLVLKREKCNFCKPELKYLGYIVNRAGLNIDAEMVKAIVDMPRPKDVRGVRRLVGTLTWFLKFVPNFATIVDPLVNLTRKPVRFKWSPECDKAFRDLQNALVQAPILVCHDFEVPFIVHCDASDVGMGAVLTQRINGSERAICYISRAFSKAERKFSATEKECLGVVSAIEKLRCYLEFTRFTVVTDCYALKWLHSLKDPLGRLGRWVLRLQNFDFTIEHRPGKDNVVSDCLSRAIPEVHAIAPDPLDQHVIGRDPWFDRLSQEIRANPLRYPNFRLEGNKIFKKIAAQDHLGERTESWKIVVPTHLRRELLQRYHDEARTGGHLGVYKTYHKLRQQYTWPKMRSDVARYISKCRSCASVKVERRLPTGLMGTRPRITRPWQLVSADLFGSLPRSTNGHEYVLVIVDYFSKFPLFVPMRQVTARKVIAEIEERVFLMFGVPEIMIVDNGIQFGRSREFNEFLENYGVQPHFNSLYTPQNNPTERVNGTMKTLIMSYIEDDQRRWDAQLSKVACAIRSAKHETTRKTPNFVNFGREVIDDGRRYAQLRERDTLSESGSDENEPEDDQQRRYRLAEIRYDVTKKLEQARQRAKHAYDRKGRDAQYEAGDVVWKREYPTTDSTEHFSAKLAKRFKGPFRVARRVGLNVYELDEPGGRSAGRWHVKNLKPYLASETESDSDGSM
jgi:hypothetical protein